MFIRALIAFLVLPGIIAGLVPSIIIYSDPWRKNGYTIGLLFMAVGFLILLWCIRDFYRMGKGTLAPWSPPKNLVVMGLYRFCRNPMYVGVLVLVGGWVLYSASLLLAVYLVILIIGFHFRVISYEEPHLSKLFGADWESYCSKVPRWLPRFRPIKKL